LLIREAAPPTSILQQETRHPRTWAWLYRSLYGKVDTVICLCDAMVGEIVDLFGVPRDKVVRIYNPVDIDRVHEQAVGGGNPYRDTHPRLVSCGRLSREKGFDLLIHAMPAICDLFPEAQLTIVGDGPLQGDLRKQVVNLGLEHAVHFAGFQRNPWPYFKYADLFVLPSRYEGMSNVLLEALALGVPIVATDCPGGNREIANIDARVRLVPTENVSRLADAIISICKLDMSSRQEFAKPKDLMRPFDLPAILDEYSAVLSG
jgi:glycosyltransferase involved in cell wall biosynthesis